MLSPIGCATYHLPYPKPLVDKAPNSIKPTKTNAPGQFEHVIITVDEWTDPESEMIAAGCIHPFLFRRKVSHKRGSDAPLAGAWGLDRMRA